MTHQEEISNLIKDFRNHIDVFCKKMQEIEKKISTSTSTGITSKRKLGSFYRLRYPDGFLSKERYRLIYVTNTSIVFVNWISGERFTNPVSFPTEFTSDKHITDSMWKELTGSYDFVYNGDV